MWIGCKQCNQTWNVSNFHKLSKSGYVCPKCARKTDQVNRERILKRLRKRGIVA